MNLLINPIVRVWKGWFTPRSTDPTVRYRERALRIILPIISVLRILGTLQNYSGAPDLPTPYAPLGISLAFFIIPVAFSFYFLARQKVDRAGVCFILHWYLVDMLSLPAEGYWYPGYQISLILQVVLGTLFLPSRAILSFMFFQLTTVGLWGNWLDVNYYDPPLLSSGQPVAVFWRAYTTLGAQEIVIVLTVRYLRLQMERSLYLQQSAIVQLEEEIKQRHYLQAEREKYIDELDKKNAELERFTYTVSHDLRSPIVTIKGFLGLLSQDLVKNRPDKVQSDFQRIASAADKMDELLTDLLELSRIGRIINPPELVDLNKLIQDALEMTNARLRSKNVAVTVAAELSALYGDRLRLREVLENLISNAVKYMGDQPNPSIEIGTSQKLNEQIIFVKDNGIGIEKRYQTRVFALFEKLNPTSEGTGIGLAIVKRIIETHGGKIWVESEGLGKGSTFCFTIPEN